MWQRKKITVWFIAVAMALGMAACGNDKDFQNTDNAGNAQTGKAEETDRADSNVEDEKQEAGKLDPESEDMAGKYTATIEETVLVDENGVKITATALEYTDYSVELNVVVENNSSGDISVTSNTLRDSCNAINGYMINDGYMNEDLSAGKKVNAQLGFGLTELSLYGIEEIADIQLGFYIEGGAFGDFYSGLKQVGTSAKDGYDYSKDTYRDSINSGLLESISGCTVDYYAEEELYDEAGVRMVSETFITNKNGEKMLLLEVENGSQDVVYGMTGNVSINGLIVNSPLWSGDSINPGARRIVDLPMESLLDKAYWEIYGISEIENVSCTFTVENFNGEEIGATRQIDIVMEGEGKSFDDSGAELYNENGIRIVSKGMVEDSSSYADDVHMLLMVENNCSSTIQVSDSYDSLSINGFMTDCLVDTRKVPVGKCGGVDVHIPDMYLEENNIEGLEEITEAEITLEIEDESYNTIAEPVLSVQY